MNLTTHTLTWVGRFRAYKQLTMLLIAIFRNNRLQQGNLPELYFISLFLLFGVHICNSLHSNRVMLCNVYVI
jgi:hypothetical protein